MSHLPVFVFLLVTLSGIAIVQGGWRCRGRDGGRCFETATDLQGRRPPSTSPTSCCSLLLPWQYPDTGCPLADQGCCIDCRNRRLTKRCGRKYGKSESGCPDCCPDGTLKIGEGRKGTGCVCCKDCKPKKRCRDYRGKKSRCITEKDLTYNRAWCEERKGTIKKKLCTGKGCWCCRHYIEP